MQHITYEFPGGIEINPARVAYIKVSTGKLADPVVADPESLEVPIPESKPIIDEFNKKLERNRGYAQKPSLTFFFSGLPGDYVTITFSTRDELSRSFRDYKASRARSYY